MIMPVVSIDCGYLTRKTASPRRSAGSARELVPPGQSVRAMRPMRLRSVNDLDGHRTQAIQ